MLAARLAAVPATALVVLAGVWFTGGVVTDDFRTSVALTTVWFGAAGLAALLIARRSRTLRWPVLGAYAVTAATAGIVLGLATLTDRVVAEQLADGTTLRAAAFIPVEHGTTGEAAIVRRPDGRHVLQFSGFETAAGPDLRVRVVPGRSSNGGADGAFDLGALKGNVGDQQYALHRIPPGPVTIVVWCRAFSAAFGSATLQPPNNPQPS